MASVDHGSSHPHNLGATRVRSHSLCGIEVYCVQQDALPGRAWHRLSNRHPMLAIVWNEAGGLSEARPSLHSSANRSNLRRHRRIGQASLIPAGLPVWCYSDQIVRVDAVRLALDVDRVFEVMGGEFQVAGLAEPRLTFFDENLQVLARLLASSQDDMPSFHLFRDSVVAAIISLQWRWRRQVLCFVHTISKNVREKWLESEKPTRAATAAMDSVGSVTMRRWALLMRVSICKRCGAIPVASWKALPNCGGDS